MAKMKALVKEQETVAIREERRPQLQGTDEVIIQVEIAGLCRTDVYVAQGRIAAAGPLILGHEFSGVISERGTQVKALKEGDRVTVNPQLACGQCPSCWAGASLACPYSRFLGVHRNGAFAEYIGVPAAAVHKLPESVSFKQGAYTEPVAASLAVLKAGITVQERGLIYGDNRISRLTHKILEAYGFTDVAIFDASQGTLPSDTYDFIIETLATTETLEEIVRAIRPRGKIILKSRQHRPVSLNFSDIIKKEPVLHAVNYGPYEEALALMADGRLALQPLCGEVYALENFADVFAKSEESEAVKLFFAPGGRESS
jgi:threonine dehydrogenase-like Zn-dependent dehydrogenase